MIQSVFNWSSGKDSALALYYAMQNPDIDIKYLFSVINSDTNRIGMHEIPIKLLKRQADAIGIPLRLFRTNFDSSYANEINNEMKYFRSQKINTSIFGDIYFEELRKYREKKCNEVGFQTLFPLWGMPPLEIIHSFVSLGFKAIVVSVDESKISKTLLGRIIDTRFIEEYPKDSDICGENGEYHSFVFDGPIFRRPVEYNIQENCITNGDISHLVLE